MKNPSFEPTAILRHRNFIMQRSLLSLPVAAIALALMWASPSVRATDTGSVLPNANTADGSGVLVNLTSGVWNTGIGFQTLNHDTSGSNNTAEGLRALFTNTTGSRNTANGVYALYSNTSGGQNTASGQNALRSNTTGSSNTATGFETLFKNNGYFNTATGYHALYANTTGNFNTGNGHQALARNTTGTGNTASGVNALVFNTIGGNNAAYGDSALYSNTTGLRNTASGYQALYSNTTGPENTAVGYLALFANTSGGQNTAMGGGALFNNTTGNSNTALGLNAGSGVTTASNVIAIGSDGANVSNSCYIGQIFGQTSSSGTTVFINSAGKLGTSTSSRRFKEEINPMKRASEALFALKPVTFRYKKEIDPQGIPQFGLVAEEVEEVSPDLVVRDGEGKVNTVRYEAVNAMLLNEFLKEHGRVQELRASAAEQKKEIAKLKQQLHDQAEAIRKVRERVDLSAPSRQLIANQE
jgi:trimeric autotransporter adhesin